MNTDPDDHDDHDDRCDDEANEDLAIRQARECARRNEVPFTGLPDEEDE